MLADGEIGSLASHLEQFRLDDQRRQIDLANLVKEYGQLIQEYKVLKQAYEKEKASPFAGSSTTVAETRPRDPYVLMLVDGNDYIFNDEFISEKEEGGMRAARKLNDAVEEYLRKNVPQTSSARVIVRIYANLTNLSLQLGKLKLTGFEKRSISSFTAAFTRALSLFDFVDTLDDEGTKFKIREQFKIAADDAACSHILYAACSDKAYMSQLVPYTGALDKITLVQGAGWDQEFYQFNLNVTQFPTVFRLLNLPSGAPASSSKPAASAPAKPKAPSQQPLLTEKLLNIRKESWRRNESVSVSDSAFGDSSPVESTDYVEQESVRWDNDPSCTPPPQSVVQWETTKDRVPCKYLKKGFCRFGKKCQFSHAPASSNASVNGSNILYSPETESLCGSPQPAVAKDDTSTITAIPIGDRKNIGAYLPQEITPGFIPLNKSNQRLDAYVEPPTGAEWKAYNDRFKKKKLCNAFHMQGNCTAFPCAFDHSELEPEVRRALLYVVKRNPCSRKGACRKENCYHGHLCQRDECTGPGSHGAKSCRYKQALHYPVEECQVSTWVPADPGQDESVMDAGAGDMVDKLLDDDQDLLW